MRQDAVFERLSSSSSPASPPIPNGGSARRRSPEPGTVNRRGSSPAASDVSTGRHRVALNTAAAPPAGEDDSFPRSGSGGRRRLSASENRGPAIRSATEVGPRFLHETVPDCMQQIAVDSLLPLAT